MVTPLRPGSSDEDDFTTPVPDTIRTIDSAFIQHSAAFLRACADDGLTPTQMQEVESLWMTWATLASTGDVDEEQVKIMLGGFRKNYPNATRGFSVAERTWIQAFGVQALPSALELMKKIKRAFRS